MCFDGNECFTRALKHSERDRLVISKHVIIVMVKILRIVVIVFTIVRTVLITLLLAITMVVIKVIVRSCGYLYGSS